MEDDGEILVWAKGRSVVICVDGKSYDLTSTEAHELAFSLQREAFKVEDGLS